VNDVIFGELSKQFAPVSVDYVLYHLLYNVLGRTIFVLSCYSIMFVILTTGL